MLKFKRITNPVLVKVIGLYCVEILSLGKYFLQHFLEDVIEQVFIEGFAKIRAKYLLT